MANFKCGRFSFALARPLVMGIINTTPDSFSDGGQFLDPQQAIAHAFALIDQGADILDIGGESTRPGAALVGVEQEWRLVAPVLEALLASHPMTSDLAKQRVAISIDTRKPEIMRRALRLGVDMVNDVEGFVDPLSIAAVLGSDCGCCIMHMQGNPLTMQQAPEYRDIVLDVSRFLYDRANSLVAAGVGPERVCIDPGIGFGKTLEHNTRLLANLKSLSGNQQWPILVGLSRKSFIGQITGRDVNHRLAGSLGAVLAAVEQGAQIVRVHDVAETVDALKVWSAIRQEKLIEPVAR